MMILGFISIFLLTSFFPNSSWGLLTTSSRHAEECLTRFASPSTGEVR